MFKEGKNEAKIKIDAKITSPMPIQSGKKPGPGPTSETYGSLIATAIT
jgi:hypothetical protein